MMPHWNLKEWLEALAYLMAVVVPLVTAIVYLLRKRHESIKTLRLDLARSWTNEGDINSEERIFVDLDLCILDGDLVGSLTCTAEEHPLEAHVEVGWGRATLSVSRLIGKSLESLGQVRLKLKGNRNRLHWKLAGKQWSELLPIETTLWPRPTDR
jgi:hypothetical protein